VVWAPSTWQGRKTVRETTTQRTRSARDMMGTEDVFESETVSEVSSAARTERCGGAARRRRRPAAADRGGRPGRARATSVTRLGGQEERHRVKTATPVHVDAEAFVGAHVRSGGPSRREAHPPSRRPARGEGASRSLVEVTGSETVAGEAGPVRARALRETNPEDGPSERGGRRRGRGRALR
jgi:hypothetical protein